VSVKIIRPGVLKPKTKPRYWGSCVECGCVFEYESEASPRFAKWKICPTKDCDELIACELIEDRPGDSFDPAAPSAKPPGGEGETATVKPPAADEGREVVECRCVCHRIAGLTHFAPCCQKCPTCGKLFSRGCATHAARCEPTSRADPSHPLPHQDTAR